MEDAPRPAAVVRKPVPPVSSVQQRAGRRGDVAKPPAAGAPKKYSPSVAASGPAARPPKGGKTGKVIKGYMLLYIMCVYYL